MAELGATEVLPHTGFCSEPKCKEGGGAHGTGPESTVIGEETAVVFAAPLAAKSLPPDVSITGKLYNLVQPTPPTAPRGSLFGAALKLPIGLTKGALEEAFAEHPLPGTEPEKKLTKKKLKGKQNTQTTRVERR